MRSAAHAGRGRPRLAVFLAILAHAPPATADPDAGDDTLVATTTPIRPVRLRRSFAIATLEGVGVNVGFNVAARMLGKDYAKITLSTVKRNLTGGWVWDDDGFTTNQFGHPYMGYLFYATARSNGFGVLGSSLFAYANSLIWEVVMENEPPSLNDQLVTPGAGILLGEPLFRMSRSVLWAGGGRPGFARYVFATLLDPVGMVNRLAFGEAWQLVEPPPSFGWLALGWSGLTTSFDTPGGEARSGTDAIHGAIVYSYGLPTSERFQPREPFDHFDFRAETSVASDTAYSTLRLRALLYGRAFGGPRLRGVWGAFGSYDFDSPERVRVSAIGLGLGTVMHAPLGDRFFLQGTALASAIPYGAAGAGLHDTDTYRDYHRGPGVTELVEVKLGRRGTGILRASAASYQIFGAPLEGGSELIVQLRAGGLLRIYDHHALGVDAAYSFRRGAYRDDDNVTDSSGQLRIYYALISDFDFGGGK